MNSVGNPSRAERIEEHVQIILVPHDEELCSGHDRPEEMVSRVQLGGDFSRGRDRRVDRPEEPALGILEGRIDPVPVRSPAEGPRRDQVRQLALETRRGTFRCRARSLGYHSRDASINVLASNAWRVLGNNASRTVLLRILRKTIRSIAWNARGFSTLRVKHHHDLMETMIPEPVQRGLGATGCTQPVRERWGPGSTG